MIKFLPKIKKGVKTLPVLAVLSIFGGFFIFLFALFLRKRGRKKDKNKENLSLK